MYPPNSKQDILLLNISQSNYVFLASASQQTGYFNINQWNYVFVCVHQWNYVLVCVHQWEGRQGSNGRKQSIRRNWEDKLNSERDEEVCLSLENKNKLSRQLPLFTGWALSTQTLEEGEGLYRRLALLHPTHGGIQCSGPSPPKPWGICDTPPPLLPLPAPNAANLPASNCFFNIGFHILRRAFVNQFFNCFLSMPVLVINMIWSWGVGYGWVKCSGLRSHDFNVATAPLGNSRRDLPLDPGPPMSSSSSSSSDVWFGTSAACLVLPLLISPLTTVSMMWFVSREVSYFIPFSFFQNKYTTRRGRLLFSG